MIIYGSRTIYSTSGHGGFHCPRCQMQRQFAHRAGRRWFTLYFIPIIPLWSAGAYIQCSSCGGEFAEEAQHHQPDPAALAASGAPGVGNALDDIRRALVLTMIEAGRASQQDATLLWQWATANGMQVSPETIFQDFQLALQASAQLGPFVQARLQSLQTNDRVALVRSARQVLSVGGQAQLSAKDVEALRTLGSSLQLMPDSVQMIISQG
jgi:zinc ribbon protein